MNFRAQEVVSFRIQEAAEFFQGSAAVAAVVN